MDKNSQDDQRLDAERRAADHHAQARELFHEFRRDGDDATLGRANEEVARADEWEQKARATGDQGFERDGEADPTSSRRTWYKQGSVAEGDPLMQLQEAEQDGSIFGQLVNYAARSTLDKDHRTFDGARLLGKTAVAPVKGASAVGRTAGKTAHAAGKGTRRTAQAADKAVRKTGRAATRAAKAAARGAHKTAKAADKAARVTGRAAAKAGRGAAKVTTAPAQRAVRGGRAILNAARSHRTRQRAPRQLDRGRAKVAARAARGRVKTQTKTRDRHREPER